MLFNSHPSRGSFIEEEDRQEGKGRLLCLGDVIECRTIHLAARIIGRKVFERTFIFDGLVWYGVNWMVIHFYKTSIQPSVRPSIHPFLQIILVLNL